MLVPNSFHDFYLSSHALSPLGFKQLVFLVYFNSNFLPALFIYSNAHGSVGTLPNTFANIVIVEAICCGTCCAEREISDRAAAPLFSFVLRMFLFLLSSCTFSLELSCCLIQLSIRLLSVEVKSSRCVEDLLSAVFIAFSSLTTVLVGFVV